jgi:hypothetical protein
MVEMEIPDDAQLTVCGDTHGQLIFGQQWFRSANIVEANSSI